MKIGVMITNGGPHPADKWAAKTAEQICDLIQIDENSTSTAAVNARLAKPKLEIAITEALIGPHTDIQTTEQANLVKYGDDRHDHSLDPSEWAPQTVEDAISAVKNAAANTPFTDHFAADTTLVVVRDILQSHFATSMDIERGWHKGGSGRVF